MKIVDERAVDVAVCAEDDDVDVQRRRRRDCRGTC